MWERATRRDRADRQQHGRGSSERAAIGKRAARLGVATTRQRAVRRERAARRGRATRRVIAARRERAARDDEKTGARD